MFFHYFSLYFPLFFSSPLIFVWGKAALSTVKLKLLTGGFAFLNCFVHCPFEEDSVAFQGFTKPMHTEHGFRNLKAGYARHWD